MSETAGGHLPHSARHFKGSDDDVMQIGEPGRLGGVTADRDRHGTLRSLGCRGPDEPLEIAEGNHQFRGGADQAEGEQAGHACRQERPDQVAP